MSDWRNWQKAFLNQARSDWNAYQRTSDPRWPSCDRLHYLQMATEKLSKALLVAGDTKPQNLMGSHAAFVTFMRAASKNRKLHEVLGLKKTPLKLHFKKLLPLAHEVELLAPALARNNPNPEYPWEDPSGKILAPVDYSFSLMDRLQESPQGLQLLKYTELFLQRFEELFM